MSVIRSRRKRHAVDPCLGLYPAPTPRSDSPEPPTPVITVESFLQRTRKRRKVLANLDSHTTEDPHAEALQRLRRRLRKMASSHPSPRKKTTIQPFSKRLLEAALSCQVDPVDNLYEGSDMVPLKFDVIRTPEPSSLKRRSISLVDPRKARPFASCSFRSRYTHASPIPKSFKSLAQSHIPAIEPTVHHKEAKKSSGQVHRRTALEFVPLENIKVSTGGQRAGIKKTRPTTQTRMPLLFDSQPAQNDYTQSLQPHSPCFKEDSLETGTETSFHRPSSPKSSPYRVLVPNSDSPGPTSPPTRALKPLASYFDEFLQTIRTATQLAADQEKH